MNNLFRNLNSKFVKNLFKSLGISCTLIATASCSNNVVNKVNRGSEKSGVKEPVLNLEVKEDKVEDNKEKGDEKVTKEDEIGLENYWEENEEKGLKKKERGVKEILLNNNDFKAEIVRLNKQIVEWRKQTARKKFMKKKNLGKKGWIRFGKY